MKKLNNFDIGETVAEKLMRKKDNPLSQIFLVFCRQVLFPYSR